MAKLSHSDSGKSWEYGLASTAANIFSVPLLASKPLKFAEAAYSKLSEQARAQIDRAASEAINFLVTQDNTFSRVVRITMQSDMRGQEGDVRDVVMQTVKGGEIGISAKHRNNSVKHSRLSPHIDFGDQWYGVACSEQYQRTTKPIWDKLAVARDEGKMWRDIPDKAQTVYAPILRAFMSEVRLASAEKLLRYMLGKYDFYKIVKENGNVLLQSFNLSGSLKWGRQLPMPRRVIDVEQVKDTTAVVTFDSGWALSFRLHNAESKASPTLKFDVKLVGTPQQANHVINYR